MLLNFHGFDESNEKKIPSKNENCRCLQNNPAGEPIVLKLKRIETSLSELKRGWFAVDVPLHQLRLYDMNLKRITVGAFDTEQFLSLRHLDLMKMELPILKEGMFTGLNCLYRLTMTDVKMLQFEKNSLSNLPRLGELTMVNCGPAILHMNGLFGSDPIPSLSHLTIRHCNLKDTITAATFSGLTGLKSLTLSQTNIQHFNEGSFDRFKKMQMKALHWNQLQQTDSQLFGVMSHENLIDHLQINPRQSHCNLEPFRELTKRTGQIVLDELFCEYSRRRVLNISKENLKENAEDKINAAFDQVADSSLNILNLAVYNEIRTIEKSQNKTLIRIEHGQLIVDDEYLSKGYDLIGFQQESLETTDMLTTTCFGQSNKSKNVDIEHLERNRIYRFCVIKRNLNTIFPRNCISFASNEPIAQSWDTYAWIMMKDKDIAIMNFILSSFFVFFIGVIASVIFAKCFPRAFKKICLQAKSEKDKSTTLERA